MELTSTNAICVGIYKQILHLMLQNHCKYKQIWRFACQTMVNTIKYCLCDLKQLQIQSNMISGSQNLSKYKQILSPELKTNRNNHKYTLPHCLRLRISYFRNGRTGVPGQIEYVYLYTGLDWIFIGSQLHLCWFPIGYLLDLHWISIRSLLNLYWIFRWTSIGFTIGSQAHLYGIRVESLLYLYWISIGSLLDLCWISFESSLAAIYMSGALDQSLLAIFACFYHGCEFWLQYFVVFTVVFSSTWTGGCQNHCKYKHILILEFKTIVNTSIYCNRSSKPW